MIHVYLDDYRRPPAGFTLARSADECILLLAEAEVDILSLDFELGWDQPTGLNVAKYIVDSGRYPRRIYLHTSSTAGRMQMYAMLAANVPDGVELYGGPMPDALLESL